MLHLVCLSNVPQTAQSKSQFGVGLECLVPPDSTQVPAVLEKCLQYIEEHGQCSMMMIATFASQPGVQSLSVTVYLVLSGIMHAVFVLATTYLNFFLYTVSLARSVCSRYLQEESRGQQ